MLLVACAFSVPPNQNLLLLCLVLTQYQPESRVIEVTVHVYLPTGRHMPPDNRQGCRSKLHATDTRELALLGGKACSGGSGLFLCLTAGQEEAPDAGDEPGLRVPYGGNHCDAREQHHLAYICMLSGKTSVLGNRLWAAASQMKVRKRVIRRRP